MVKYRTNIPTCPEVLSDEELIKGDILWIDAFRDSENSYIVEDIAGDYLIIGITKSPVRIVPCKDSYYL